MRVVDSVSQGVEAGVVDDVRRSELLKTRQQDQATRPTQTQTALALADIGDSNKMHWTLFGR